MFETIMSSNAMRLAFLLCVFLLVSFLAMATLSLIGRRFVIRAQLQQIADRAHTPMTPTSLRGKSVDNAWAKIAASVEAAGLNLADTNNDRLAAKLRSAGYTSPLAPRVFTLIRLVMIFALPLGYLVVAWSSATPPSFVKLYLIGAGLGLLGLYLPNLFVQAKADRRREAIVHGFPDCLDLLLVCVESGLGVEAAIDRVGREMTLSHPLVAELLSVTSLQLRAGATREEAFRKLANSSSVEEIRSFTTLLIQSDKLGTSIATTLRVYAAEMREKRRMRAEEKAHRLPVLISIPLVVCMLPVMIGVLMLPAAIRVVREIIPLMTGG
jgi:tight adherence protein C